MTRHACPRCGFESSRDRWWDRHPIAAVLFALPAGYTLVGVIHTTDTEERVMGDEYTARAELQLVLGW